MKLLTVILVDIGKIMLALVLLLPIYIYHNRLGLEEDTAWLIIGIIFLVIGSYIIGEGMGSLEKRLKSNDKAREKTVGDDEVQG